MKREFLMILLSGTLLAGSAFADDVTITPPVNLSTDQAKLSYAFGLNMGKNLRTHEIKIDPAVFSQGLNDGLSGTPAAMTPAQIKVVIDHFRDEMITKQQEQMKIAAEKNLQAGDAFMKDFVAQPGVTKLNDDIAYKIVAAGNGPKPTATDTVSIVYEGKLINGMTFDSTKANGNKPLILPISKMIPGMQKVLMSMPVGSTYQAVMSPKVAYGERGVPMSPVGPNETLVFTLSLKSVTPTAVNNK